MGWFLLITGLVIALTASLLMVMGLVESGPATLIGVIGIGLIAASGRWFRRQ